MKEGVKDKYGILKGRRKRRITGDPGERRRWNYRRGAEGK